MKADVPAWISPVVIFGVFALMLLGEVLRPLRARVQPKLRHTIRNLSTGGISLAILTLLQAPLLVPAARWAERHDVGIVRWLHVPSPWNVIVAIILLDYTLWWWHWASHVVPVLWRFHLVHHIDLDLDSSTALRFHFGELTLSVFYRALQIILIGATPFSGVAVADDSLCVDPISPRQPPSSSEVRGDDGASVRDAEDAWHSSLRSTGRDHSNWSSLLSVWDRLHGTMRGRAR